MVSLTAASTGNISAYFYSANTAGNDQVRLYNVTQNTYSAFVLNAPSSTMGQMFNLGTANKGDVLVFQLVNYAMMSSGTGNYPLMASDPTYSADKINHTYITGFSGSGSIPSGIYVAFEDYIGGYDFDYNDDTFVVTNIAASTVTPEPASWLLLGTGLLSGVGVLRRRFA